MATINVLIVPLSECTYKRTNINELIEAKISEYREGGNALILCCKNKKKKQPFYLIVK